MLTMPAPQAGPSYPQLLKIISKNNSAKNNNFPIIRWISTDSWSKFQCSHSYIQQQYDKGFFIFVSIKLDESLNPSATPPSTKDESAFLARILANKAFSPLIPGTRSSRGNGNAIRGPQAGQAKAGSRPSVWASATSYLREQELCKEPDQAENRRSDS